MATQGAQEEEGGAGSEVLQTRKTEGVTTRQQFGTLISLQTNGARPRCVDLRWHCRHFVYLSSGCFPGSASTFAFFAVKQGEVTLTT